MRRALQSGEVFCTEDGQVFLHRDHVKDDQVRVHQDQVYKRSEMFKVQINVRRAHFPPVDIHPIRTTLMGHKLQETFHLILTQKDLLKFLCHGTKNLSEKINPQPTCQKRLSRSQKLTYGGAGNISLSQKIS